MHGRYSSYGRYQREDSFPDTRTRFHSGRRAHSADRCSHRTRNRCRDLVCTRLPFTAPAIARVREPNNRTPLGKPASMLSVAQTILIELLVASSGRWKDCSRGYVGVKLSFIWLCEEGASHPRHPHAAGAHRSQHVSPSSRILGAGHQRVEVVLTRTLPNGRKSLLSYGVDELPMSERH